MSSRASSAKLRGPLVQFLVDLCRPSQLNVEPVSAGLLLFRRAAGDGARHRARGAAGCVARNGKRRWRRDRRIQSAGYGAPQPARAQPGARHAAGAAVDLPAASLFNDVLVKDEAALGASGSSTKTTRHAARAAGLRGRCLCLVCDDRVHGFLLRQPGSAERGDGRRLKGIPASEASGMNLPSQDALQRLERLRRSLGALTDYEAQGAPWRLRWLLYSGDEFTAEGAEGLLRRFHQLLFGQTRTEMLATSSG